MRNLRHLGVIFAESFLLLANLVVAFGFQQHARVRTGQPNDGEGSDHGSSDKPVGVLDGNRDLANLPVIVSGDKQDVIALA